MFIESCLRGVTMTLCSSVVCVCLICPDDGGVSTVGPGCRRSDPWWPGEMGRRTPSLPCHQEERDRQGDIYYLDPLHSGFIYLF